MFSRVEICFLENVLVSHQWYVYTQGYPFVSLLVPRNQDGDGKNTELQASGL